MGRALRWVGALAAAVIIAFAATGVAIELRSSASPTSPSSPRQGGQQTVTAAADAERFDFATGDWGWVGIRGAAPATVARVAAGYVGACVRDGVPAVCTSKNSIDWTLPADPSIFSNAAATRFAAWQVAVHGARWVAASAVDGSVWHSADGVRWAPVTLPVTTGTRAEVHLLAGGFVVAVTTRAGGFETSTRMFTSTDGTAWTELAPPAGDSVLAPLGDAGVLARGPNGAAWISTDGRTWVKTTEAAPPFETVVVVPSGGFVGLVPPGPGRDPTLRRSPDAIAWSDAGLPGSTVLALARGGDALLAVATLPGGDLPALFASTDGVTWRRLATIEATPLATATLVSLGDRVAAVADGRVVAVGMPLPRNAVVATASPARPSPTPAPPADVPVVADGWRWHALNLVPDAPPLKLPRGYLGSCGRELCTSANGWFWSVPADPAIFSAPEATHFVPTSIAHRPGGNYVMTAGSGVWYSTDGVHWRAGSFTGRSIDAVLASSEGFAAQVYDGNSVYPYLSADGATWTKSDLADPIFMQTEIGEAAGWLANVGAKFHWRFTSDGRHWVPAQIPADQFPSGTPRRLSTGQLVLGFADTLLVSADGVTWTAPSAGDSHSVAVVRDRILRNGSAGVIESSDAGRTFHPLIEGRAEQFGDLLELTRPDGSFFVGAPLTAEETATSTQTPVWPGALVTSPPMPSPEAPPAGGIGRAAALEIAAKALGLNADQAAKANVGASRDVATGRWVWVVSVTDDYAGPDAASGRSITLDFFTGEVLRMSPWIS